MNIIDQKSRKMKKINEICGGIGTYWYDDIPRNYRFIMKDMGTTEVIADIPYIANFKRNKQEGVARCKSILSIPLLLYR